MKTEVIMKRQIFDCEISQKSKSEMFSATDLVRAGNRWRILNGMDQFNMSEWFRLKSTKEFIAEMEQKFGNVKISGRGRGKHTWVHPFVFIDMALAISPKIKIEVYEWLYDHLLKYRNSSGDSYKEMCGYLYARHTDKSSFHKYVTAVAKNIKLKCGVSDWQSASVEQLEKRDKIHREIALLSDVLRDNDQAVRQAMLRN